MTLYSNILAPSKNYNVSEGKSPILLRLRRSRRDRVKIGYFKTIIIVYGLRSHAGCVQAKIHQTKMLVTCQRFGDLGWSGSTLPIRTNIIKVGSKLRLLTCSSNITLSLPSYIGSDW